MTVALFCDALKPEEEEELKRRQLQALRAQGDLARAAGGCGNACCLWFLLPVIFLAVILILGSIIEVFHLH